MGAYAADSGSEQSCEKAQAKAAPKQSYCPFVLFRQYRRDRREKRDQARRPEIEKIREQVTQSQKMLKQMQKSRWARTTCTEQRRKIFEHGLESRGFYNSGRTYRKGRKYKLTWTGDREERSVIHDLSSAKGCNEAFEWWGKNHATQSSAMTYYISECGRFLGGPLQEICQEARFPSAGFAS